MQFRTQIMWSGPSMVRPCGRAAVHGCAVVIHFCRGICALTAFVLTASKEVLHYAAGPLT